MSWRYHYSGLLCFHVMYVKYEDEAPNMNILKGLANLTLRGRPPQHPFFFIMLTFAFASSWYSAANPIYKVPTSETCVDSVLTGSSGWEDFVKGATEWKMDRIWSNLLSAAVIWGFFLPLQLSVSAGVAQQLIALWPDHDLRSNGESLRVKKMNSTQPQQVKLNNRMGPVWLGILSQCSRWSDHHGLRVF